MDERLLQEGDLLEVALQAAFDDLLHDVIRLAGILVAQDGALALDGCLVHARGIQRHRVRGSHVHGDLAAESPENGHVPLGLERHEDADLAETFGHRVVDIGRDHALGHFELGDPAQGHVLADGGDELLQTVLHGGLRTGEVSGLERLDGAVAHQADLGGFANEGLELVVAGNEVRLGIHLENRRGVTGGLHRHKALGRHAASLLRCLRQPLLAEPVDCGLHVTVCLGESGLAVHHAGAGRLAQLFHHRSGNVRHGHSFQRFMHRGSPALVERRARSFVQAALHPAAP